MMGIRAIEPLRLPIKSCRQPFIVPQNYSLIGHGRKPIPGGFIYRLLIGHVKIKYFCDVRLLSGNRLCDEALYQEIAIL